MVGVLTRAHMLEGLTVAQLARKVRTDCVLGLMFMFNQRQRGQRDGGVHAACAALMRSLCRSEQTSTTCTISTRCCCICIAIIATSHWQCCRTFAWLRSLQRATQAPSRAVRGSRRRHPLMQWPPQRQAASASFRACAL
jgi:hypothetical protein